MSSISDKVTDKTDVTKFLKGLKSRLGPVLLQDVVTYENMKQHLNDEEREQLNSFLPEGFSDEDLKKLLDCEDVSYIVNPISQVQDKINKANSRKVLSAEVSAVDTVKETEKKHMALLTSILGRTKSHLKRKNSYGIESAAFDICVRHHKRLKNDKIIRNRAENRFEGIMKQLESNNFETLARKKIITDHSYAFEVLNTRSFNPITDDKTREGKQKKRVKDGIEYREMLEKRELQLMYHLDNPVIQKQSSWLAITTKKEKSVVEAMVKSLRRAKISSFFVFLYEIFKRVPNGQVELGFLEECVTGWIQAKKTATRGCWELARQDWPMCVESALEYMSTEKGKNLVKKCPDSSNNEWQWRGVMSRARALASEFGWDVVSAGNERETVPTEFCVRPSTRAEKEIYHAQERERYLHPEKATTFKVHDYEANVGPVRHLGSKRGRRAIKPRPHFALVEDRPYCVTVVSLVRDSASRLPNGVGVRGDIVELFRDSQYINPDLTEEQLTTLVSCALDRMQAEADPCVKYDPQKKVWVYLHHTRTKEMLEKHHKIAHEANKAKQKFMKNIKANNEQQVEKEEENENENEQEQESRPHSKESKYGLQPAPQYRKMYMGLCQEMAEIFGDSKNNDTDLEDIFINTDSEEEDTIPLVFTTNSNASITNSRSINTAMFATTTSTTTLPTEKAVTSAPVVKRRYRSRGKGSRGGKTSPRTKRKIIPPKNENDKNDDDANKNESGSGKKQKDVQKDDDDDDVEKANESQDLEENKEKESPRRKPEASRRKMDSTLSFQLSAITKPVVSSKAPKKRASKISKLKRKYQNPKFKTLSGPKSGPRK